MDKQGKAQDTAALKIGPRSRVFIGYKTSEWLKVDASVYFFVESRQNSIVVLPHLVFRCGHQLF